MSLFDSASICITPNGVKEGKLYSIKPTDGSGDLSVTRATTATRVNSAGLVEVVPRNLIQQSSTFNVSPWVNSGVTLTSGITDVNGGTNAFRFQCPATNSFIYNLASATTGTQYTHSIYARSVSGTQSIRIEDAYSGAFVNTTLNTEWQRITLTFNATINEVGILIYNNYGAYATDIYICFAQTEQGATATDYYPTTTRLNIPRLDYTNGSCPSILVEPQRTNLALRSQEFDNAAWSKINATVTANTIVSPDGTQNADKFVENNGTGEKWIYNVPIVISGSVYTYSVFAKKGERDFIYINAFSNGNRRAWFNLNTGTIGATDAGVSAKIENYGNGWYRCSVTFTAVIGVQFYLLGVSNANNVIDYTGDGTSGIYIWGAQNELGSYPTSYIPTTTASVTRNSDVISKTGISSLIGQTEGTIFFDGVVNGCENPFANLLNGARSTNSSFYLLYVKSSKVISCGVWASNSLKASIAGGVYQIGQRFKVAYSYKSGDSVLYINGVQIGTSADTFTLPSSLSEINIGDAQVFFGYGEDISNNTTSLFKTRLTNAELAQLTTI
jgi:hypothetical protein